VKHEGRAANLANSRIPKMQSNSSIDELIACKPIRYTCELVVVRKSRMRVYLKTICLPVLVMLLLTGSIRAEAQTDLNETAAAISRTIDEIFQPSHQRFVEATRQLLESAEISCRDRSAQAVSRLRADYESLISAFARIELYRMGPMTEQLRQNRLFYWPDKRRVGERQLRELLSSASSATLTEAALIEKSVALQGIPALERLLYSKNATENLVDVQTSNCHVATIITQNLHSMATAMNEGWTDESGLVSSMRDPTGDSRTFRNHQEVLQRLATLIVVGVDVVLDKKIQPLVGDNVSVKNAPLWLSEQTVTMITENHHGIRSLLIDSGLATDTGLEDELQFEFRTVDSILEKLASLPSLTDEHTQLTRQTLSLTKALSAVVGGIQSTLNDRFVQRLGISAGFNSEDGD